MISTNQTSSNECVENLMSNSVLSHDDVKFLLKRFRRTLEPLSFDEAYAASNLMVRSSQAGSRQGLMDSVMLLSNVHNSHTYSKEGAEEQIAGMGAAVLLHGIHRTLKPSVPLAIDNCGMGGDGIVTANVSTIAALIASAAGVTMVKHGSPANADRGRHGSSDFIEKLGIPTMPDIGRMERTIERENFGYCEALDARFKDIHLVTHDFARLPHANDLIGPLTHPLDVSIHRRKIIGINELLPPETVARACKILNDKGITRFEKVMCVRGFAHDDRSEGMDEASICPGGTDVSVFENGRVESFRLHAGDFGIDSVAVEAISPPRGVSKGDFSIGILEGREFSAPAQMVCANASAILCLAGVASDYKEGFRQSMELLLGGKAKAVARNVRESLISSI